jgi:hypothetical protein
MIFNTKLKGKKTNRRERWQRERAPAEGESAGEGRECWRQPGVRDSERERVDEL